MASIVAWLVSATYLGNCRAIKCFKMPTTFLLIRHGATSHLDRILSGRAPGVPLNDEGRTQAETLSGLLAATPIHHVFSSPLERTRQTAEILAKPHNLAVVEHPALLETDWGDWTLQPFATLNKDPSWRAFNRARAVTCPPNGESFQQVTTRVVAWLEAIAAQYSQYTIALVSHADPIKAVLLTCLQRPLSDIQNLTIEPATYSAIVFPGTTPPRVLCINNRQTEPRMLPTYIA